MENEDSKWMQLFNRVEEIFSEFTEEMEVNEDFDYDPMKKEVITILKEMDKIYPFSDWVGDFETVVPIGGLKRYGFEDTILGNDYYNMGNILAELYPHY